MRSQRLAQRRHLSCRAPPRFGAATGASASDCRVPRRQRPLLRDHERPWLDEWRRRLDDVRVRGLAPFRETGYVILMEALERSGNVAEALRVYDELRVILRDELAIAPSLAVQTVYPRLLGEAATKTV